ncbi:hypothetical protein [Robertmurraya sp.]|uniref:hypothetical protein n=1 Tax=Robertmurraya sp. TaxID=2837525 RepID=UPI003704BF89
MEFKNSADMFSQNTKAMRETNDCTVKAFAVVFDTTYEKAHAHLKHNCGRQNRKGIISRDVLAPSLKKTKYKIGPYSKTNRITLKNFIEKHNTGRFYVCVRGHALAVVDGVIYDYKEGLRRQVTWAMRVYLGE